MGWINTSAAFIGDLIGDIIPQIGPVMNELERWGIGPGVPSGSIFEAGSPSYAGGSPTLPTQYAALPGGAPAYQGGFQTVAGIPGYDLMVPESQRIQPYTTDGRPRMPSSVTVPYQVNGKTKYAYYKNMGRPVLYSGDFAACKRVKRVASKARRRSGGR